MRYAKALSWAALASALALTIGCKLLPDNEWPEPYTSMAKAEVLAPIDIQVANARAVEQTLWDYHFNSRSDHLNSTGVERLRWIVSHARRGHPVIYVAATDDAELTKQRLARVQAALVDIAGEHSGLEVAQVEATPVKQSGRHVETVFKKMEQTGFATPGGAATASAPKPPTP